jgi:hypothetical protein
MVRPKDLLQRIRSEPFHPFNLVLTDGTRLEVAIPRMLVAHDKALIVTKWKHSPRGFPIALDWRTVPLAMIEQITNGVRQKRRTAKR